MTLPQHIAIVESGGRQVHPRAPREAVVPMPYDGMTREQYARR